jgi:hypothetical protein
VGAKAFASLHYYSLIVNSTELKSYPYVFTSVVAIDFLKAEIRGKIIKPQINTRKLVTGFLVIALAVQSSPGFAVNKASGSCLKIGKTATIESIKYVCQKSGKKLIWVKRVSVPSTIATPTPTPNPLSATSKTSAPVTNIGLANEIALSAFNSISEYQKSTPNLPDGYVIVEMSPNAQQSLTDATLKDLQMGAQFWQAFTSASAKIHMVFADRSDLIWFEQKMISLQPNNTNWIGRILTMAQSGGQYAGANGGDLQGNFLYFFLPDRSTIATSSGWLGVGPHEWTHTAQQAISGNINRLPCWFKEGQATLYGNAISNNSQSEWASHWKHELNTVRYGFNSFYTLNLQDLAIWFQSHSYNMPNNVCGPEGAGSIGAIATEYLVGTLGVTKINELVAQLNSGGKWEPYLEKLMGKPIDQIMNEIFAYIFEIRKWMTSTS